MALVYYLHKPLAALLIIAIILSFGAFAYIIADSVQVFRLCWGYWFFLFVAVFGLFTLFPSIFYFMVALRYIYKVSAKSNAIDMNRVKTPFSHRKILSKILITIFAIFLLILSSLLIACMALVINWSAFTRPHYTSTFVGGVNGQSVTIERSKEDIVRVIGKDVESIAYGQGFVHCQERYYQMDIYRRIANGRYSELVGKERGLDSDKFFKTLGIGHYANVTYQGLSSEMKNILNHYAKGCNDFIANNPNYAFEQRVFNIPYTDWTPLDTISVLKLFQWSQSGNYLKELNRYRLLVRGVSPDRVRQLEPMFPEHGVTSFTPSDWGESAAQQIIFAQKESETLLMEIPIVEKLAQKVKSAKVSENEELIEDLNQLFSGWDFSLNGFKAKGASTTLLVHKSATDTGAPILASNHISTLEAPNQFFVMQLQVNNDTFKLFGGGASIPGIPGIFSGRNYAYSYTVSNLMADCTDLFVIKDLGNGEYSDNKTTHKYMIRNEEIDTLEGEKISISVKETIFGPVISDAIKNKPGDHPLALKWSLLKSTDESIEFFWKAWQLDNMNAFKNLALNKYSGHPALILYGDTDSNMLATIGGKIPERQQGHTGLFPVDGESTIDWIGFIPNVAHRIEKYSIIHTNNRPIGRGFRYSYGFDFEDSFRLIRLNETVENTIGLGSIRKALTKSDVQNFFRDRISQFGRELVAAVIPQIPDGTPGKRELQNWNGDTSADNNAAMLFHAFYYELTKLVAKETGVNYWDRPTFILQAFESGIDPACPEGNCINFLKEALETAYRNYRSTNWGSRHYLHFSHRIANEGAFKCVCERTMNSLGGTSDTIYTFTEYGPSNDFIAKEGPTYKQICVHSKNDCEFLMPMGNSGHQYAKSYYDGWLEKYQSDTYTPIDLAFETYYKQEIKP